MNASLPVLFAAIIFGSGCIHHPLQKPARAAAALPANFAVPRQQGTIPTLATQEEIRKGSSYTLSEITLNVGPGRTLRAQYFLPEARKHRPEKMPAIVILPIMGGSTY